jgi:hypothetical protein
MARRRRRRKSRTEALRARAHRLEVIQSRVITLQRGGNPQGASEWSLRAAHGPEAILAG